MGMSATKRRISGAPCTTATTCTTMQYGVLRMER